MRLTYVQGTYSARCHPSSLCPSDPPDKKSRYFIRKYLPLIKHNLTDTDDCCHRYPAPVTWENGIRYSTLHFASDKSIPNKLSYRLTAPPALWEESFTVLLLLTDFIYEIKTVTTLSLFFCYVNPLRAVISTFHCFFYYYMLTYDRMLLKFTKKKRSMLCTI